MKIDQFKRSIQREEYWGDFSSSYSRDSTSKRNKRNKKSYISNYLNEEDIDEYLSETDFSYSSDFEEYISNEINNEFKKVNNELGYIFFDVKDTKNDKIQARKIEEDQRLLNNVNSTLLEIKNLKESLKSISFKKEKAE